MTAIGASVVRTNQEFVFDPQYGDQTSETWQGTQAGVITMEAAFRSIGARTRVSHDGPVWRLDVLMPGRTNDDAGEVPSTNWDIVTETIQADMSTSPKLQYYAETKSSAALASWRLMAWIKDVDAAIEAGQTLFQYLQVGSPGIVEGSIDPGWLAIYNLRAQGERTYEYHRPVLVRVRTYSAAYLQRYAIDIIPKFYSTARLVSDFGIPPGIAALLPSGGSSIPLSKTWGWRLRSNDQHVISALNKVEERTDWIFDLWPQMEYDYVS